VVAYEMAEQLRGQGERVELLALFDSAAPHANGKNGKGFDERRLLPMFARDMGVDTDALAGDVERLSGLTTEEQLAYLLEQAKREGIVASNTSLEQLTRSFAVFKNNVSAVLGYRPRPSAGGLTLLKAEGGRAGNGKDAAGGWGRLAREGVAVRTVGGDHYTMMREPHVRGLAEQLRACLDGLNAKEGGA